MSEKPPQPLGTVQQWGERLNAYLQRVRDKLNWKEPLSRATENGMLLWDNGNEYPVVSLNDEWVPLHTGGSTYSYGYFVDTTDQTCTTVDTATPITWNTAVTSQNISIDGTDASKINFAKTGVYSITFTAELYSASANSKTFYFWPKVNGTSYANTTMVITLESNGQAKTISRAAVFHMDAGDYLQAFWAVDDLDTKLDAVAATAFAPAAPSATLSVIEVSNS